MNLIAAITIFMVTLWCLMPHTVVGFKPKDKSAKTLSNDAKLVMTLKSDDVLVRKARGSDVSQAPVPEVKSTIEEAEPKISNGAGNKRGKHGGNRKLNRNQDFNHSSGSGRKSHMEKKLINSGEQDQQQQQQQHRRQQSLNRQQNGQLNSNKQHQMLKSQNQEHQKQQEGKRKLIHKTEEQEIENSKTQSTCRYTKSPWSDCDKSTNTHSRTLTLKKGDSNCLPTRTIQKKCKKTCRYEKGAWSECKDSEMTRIDKLKNSTSPSSSTSSSCESLRIINRKCNQERKNNNGKSKKKERKNKDEETKHQPA